MEQVVRIIVKEYDPDDSDSIILHYLHFISFFSDKKQASQFAPKETATEICFVRFCKSAMKLS